MKTHIMCSLTENQLDFTCIGRIGQHNIGSELIVDAVDTNFINRGSSLPTCDCDSKTWRLMRKMIIWSKIEFATLFSELWLEAVMYRSIWLLNVSYDPRLQLHSYPKKEKYWRQIRIVKYWLLRHWYAGPLQRCCLTDSPSKSSFDRM